MVNQTSYDPWDEVELSPQDQISNYQNKKEKDPWDDLDFDEGFWKNAMRYIAQIPKGMAQVTMPGIITNLMQMINTGEVFDPEEIERLREISEREGIPFDENAYLEAANEALRSFPTVSNIASMIEEETGIPLEAKTQGQKLLEFATGGAKLTSGTLPQKAISGATTAAVKGGLEELGVPEIIADIPALAAGQIAGAKTPAMEIQTTKLKPSGLTERQFESLQKPREISEKRLKTINDKVKKEFDELSSKIIEESPVGETAKNLKENPAFKQEARELLGEAQEIANGMKENISLKNYKKELADIQAKESKGFAESEYDKEFKSFIKRSIKEIKGKVTSPGKFVEQYRKNNQELSEYFEPGASKSLNRAKRDAILAKNVAISNLMEKKFPNSELVPVFKEGNARWTKIKDVEAIDDFVNDVFQEKINYKKIHDFFDKENYGRIFKRSLGEKGFKEFEQLLKDMLTSEAPYKMLKVADQKGFGDLVTTASAYLLSPKLGALKTVYGASKEGFKFLMNSMLDKPKIVFNLRKGVQELGKGDFAKASESFKKIDEESKFKKIAKTIVEEKKSQQRSKEFKVKDIPKESLKETSKTSKKPEIQFKDSKETERSRFSHIKDAYDKKGDYLGGLSYDIEPSGEIFVSGIYVEPALKRKGIGTELFKDLLTHNEGKDIILSPLMPEGAEFFSKIIGREIKPQLTELYEKIPKRSQEPIKLTKKDIVNAKKNLGIKERDLKTKKSKIPKIDYDAVEKTLEEIHARESAPAKEYLKKLEKEEKTPKILKEKLPEIKRQDISTKGLKTQKNWILDKLEDAINYPEKYKGQEKIELNVPGDGEFKIHNNIKALQQFHKSVKSKWPDKPIRKSRAKSNIQYEKHHFKDYEIAEQIAREEELKRVQNLTNRKSRKK